MGAIESVASANETLNQTVESKYATTTYYDGVGGSSEGKAWLKPEEELDLAIAEYHRLQDEIDTLNKSYDDGTILLKDYEDQLEDLTNKQNDARSRASEMNDILDECGQAYNNLKDAGGLLTTLLPKQIKDTMSLLIQFMGLTTLLRILIRLKRHKF